MRILFAILLTFNLSAQIGTGQWRLHVPNKIAIDVVVGNNSVYTAFGEGLMEYDISTSETSLWTDVNYLSDVSLTCLGYVKEQNSLYIGYQNGNIDLIKNNTVTNIPAIKLAQIMGSKRINKIVSHQNYIYFATGFSIVKFDPVKIEIRDTYYPTNGTIPILDIAFRNDSIFALTSTKMLRGLLKNPALADSSQWKIDLRVPINTSVNTYKEIEVIENQLFLLLNVPDIGKDSVFNVRNNGLELVLDKADDFEINSLGNFDNKLAVNYDKGITIYNSDYSISSNLVTPFVSVNKSCSSNGVIWVADKLNGLVKYVNGSVERIDFQGPPNNRFYSLDCQKGKLVVAGGGLDGHASTWNSAGFYTFKEEKWKLTDWYNTPLWIGKNIWDFLAVSVNPTDNTKTAIGTFSEIPLSIVENETKVVEMFTIENSPLEKTIWNPYSMVTDVKYDESGNLWVANSFCSHPLKVYTKDKKWQTFELGGSTQNKLIKQIEIDYNGNKWLAVPSVGIIALNDNKTFDNLGDDKFKIINSGETTGALPSNEINAIAVDFNNEIWIGTDNGFAILYNSANVFDAATGSYNAQRIKLKFEGENEYLLGKTNITDIEVDGGNRKWLGTANAGIFLLSADGTEIIQNFTTDNSPLISNTIMDMVFDQNTGELFIVTDKGLISYRSDATFEDPEYSNVKVFPNPAKPDFSGPITIQGIKYDSDINVTDIAGNLVYKTTSNGGTATWNGKTLEGERVKAGVYLFWTAPNEGKGRKVGKVVVVN